MELETGVSEESRNKATPANPFSSLSCHTARLSAEAWPTVPSMENWVSSVVGGEGSGKVEGGEEEGRESLYSNKGGGQAWEKLGKQ